jgi:hypothetical protein
MLETQSITLSYGTKNVHLGEDMYVINICFHFALVLGTPRTYVCSLFVIVVLLFIEVNWGLSLKSKFLPWGQPEKQFLSSFFKFYLSLIIHGRLLAHKKAKYSNNTSLEKT